MLEKLQKPGVQMGLLVVVLAVAGGAYMLMRTTPQSSNQETVAKVEEAKAAADQVTGKTNTKTASTDRTAQVEVLSLPPRKPPAPSVTTLTAAPKKQEQPPPLPKLVHIVNTTPEPFVPQEPEVFAPRGLLIKAALVITVDSSSLETPVLALVIEDVYWNGRLIVPAGTQVQAEASQGRTRDRIEVKGTYNFVWADGREYRIMCVALDHERLSDGTYGITDGSAGIRGQIIKNDQYAEIKILMAEALQGIMNNQQSQFQSIYGLVPDNTSRNAALGGGSKAASAYSELLTSKLEKDLDYVRVAAGTQFYIYTQDVFEPDLASIAGLRQKGMPSSSWQLAEDSYARAQTAAAASAQKGELTAAEEEKARLAAEKSQQAGRMRTLLNPPPASASAAAAAPAAAGAQPVSHTTSQP